MNFNADLAYPVEDVNQAARDWDDEIQTRIKESIDDQTIKTSIREWLVDDLMGGQGEASKQLVKIALELLSAAQNNPHNPVIINPQQFSAFDDFIDETAQRYAADEDFRAVIKTEILEEEKKYY